MIEYYFLMLFVWTLFFLGIKLLKDYTTTTISSLLIMALGIYGFFISLGINPLAQAISLGNIALGFYWVIKSSLQLNKEWEENLIIKTRKWLLKRKNKNLMKLKNQ